MKKRNIGEQELPGIWKIVSQLQSFPLRSDFPGKEKPYWWFDSNFEFQNSQIVEIDKIFLVKFCVYKSGLKVFVACAILTHDKK